MGLLERSMDSRMETSGTSISFLSGLLKLAEIEGEEILREVDLALPRNVYERMIQTGAFIPRPRSGGDRRSGDRRSGNRRN